MYGQTKEQTGTKNDTEYPGIRARAEADRGESSGYRNGCIGIYSYNGIGRRKCGHNHSREQTEADAWIICNRQQHQPDSTNGKYECIYLKVRCAGGKWAAETDTATSIAVYKKQVTDTDVPGIYPSENAA